MSWTVPVEACPPHGHRIGISRSRSMGNHGHGHMVALLLPYLVVVHLDAERHMLSTTDILIIYRGQFDTLDRVPVSDTMLLSVFHAINMRTCARTNPLLACLPCSTPPHHNSFTSIDEQCHCARPTCHVCIHTCIHSTDKSHLVEDRQASAEDVRSVSAQLKPRLGSSGGLQGQTGRPAEWRNCESLLYDRNLDGK